MKQGGDRGGAGLVWCEYWVARSVACDDASDESAGGVVILYWSIGHLERAEWVPNRDHIAPRLFMREMQRQGRVHMLRSHDHSISFEQKYFVPKINYWFYSWHGMTATGIWPYGQVHSVKAATYIRFGFSCLEGYIWFRKLLPQWALLRYSSYLLRGKTSNKFGPLNIRKYKIINYKGKKK